MKIKHLNMPTLAVFVASIILSAGVFVINPTKISAAPANHVDGVVINFCRTSLSSTTQVKGSFYNQSGASRTVLMKTKNGSSTYYNASAPVAYGSTKTFTSTSLPSTGQAWGSTSSAGGVWYAQYISSMPLCK